MFAVSHFCRVLFPGVIGLLLWGSGIALAATPDSPEVKAMIQRGVHYIATHHASTDQELSLSAACASGLACHAISGDVNHPVVSKALAAVRATTQAAQDHETLNADDLGLALIFVCRVDAYSRDAEWLLDALYQRQRPDGAWGESEQLTENLRTTETVCFAMWMAQRCSMKVRETSLARTINWLLDQQSDDGSFGDPSITSEQSQPATERRLRTAAALGSLYLCGDIFGWVGDPATMNRRDGYPIAVEHVVAARTCLPDEAHLHRALHRGNHWLANCERQDGPLAQDMDAFYRGMQIIDYYDAIHQQFAKAAATSKWYDNGADILRASQLVDGSWQLDRNSLLDTARCVLFLLQQTNQAVHIFGFEVARRRDCLRPKVLTAEQRAVIERHLESGGGVADLLRLLESTDLTDVTPLELSTDPLERRQQLIRLRQMVATGNFRARWAAAVTLGTVRDLESVPVLIEALTDPDFRVILAARDALRFISRDPDRVALEFVGRRRPSEATLEAAQADWKEWLRSVEPESVRD